MKDYYAILEVPSNASQEKIDEQHRFLAQAWHPDKFHSPAQKAKAEEKMKEINAAYEVLGNPAKRAQYDRERTSQSSSFSKEEKERYDREQAEAAHRYAEEESARSANAAASRRRAEDEQRRREQTDAARSKPKPDAVPAGTNIKWITYAAFGIGLLVILVLAGVFSPQQKIHTVVPPTAPLLAATAEIIPTTVPTYAAQFTVATSSLPQSTNDPSICITIGQTWTSPIDSMTVVCVPAGEFLMGAADSDTTADAEERPQHKVTLNAFWIDQTEVTNRQFSLFVQSTNYLTDAEKGGMGWTQTQIGSNWVQTNGASWKQPKGPGSDLRGKQDHPVVQVSWNDANAYCQWAGRRLPSEAEWEKAGRGPDGRLYPWGNTAPTISLLNYNNSYGDTTPVGKFPLGASPYHALDMAGNVWEWVADWTSETYYASSPSSNPPGPSNGSTRRLRGGSWSVPPAIGVRTSDRGRGAPDYRDGNFGFRCAASP